VIAPQSSPLPRLRRMRLEDVEQVHAIDVLSFSLPWSERSYRYEVGENQNSRCWVAEVVDAQGQARVVGMLVVWVILDEAHVANLAVLPEFRQRGLGRRLLARGLLDAAASGTTQSFLEVRRSNLAAQTLYRQFGYQVVGVRHGYYLDNHEDALLMTLDPMRVDVLRKAALPDDLEER
jgi:ribosomal-protein-alanine N-acetyltransferase